MTVPAGAVRPAPAGAAVKVRLSGTRRGCAEAAARLHRVCYVASVSQPYPDPGASQRVKVYLRIRLDLPSESPPGGKTGDPR